MKKMKWICAGIMTFAMISLAACASGKSAPGSEKKEGQGTEGQENIKTENADGEKIEIRLLTPWTVGTDQYDSIEALIERYKTDHPDIVIMHDSLSSNEVRTKLTVEMAAGNPADISWCPINYAQEYIKDNLIIDWKPIVEDPDNPEFKQWFSQGIFDSLTDDQGRLLLCPQQGAIDALYYNREMFEEHGWKPPETWDELMDLVPKIRDAGITPLACGGKDSRFAWLASALLVRCGGRENFRELCAGDAMTKWDDPSYGFVTAMTKLKEFIDAGGFVQGVLGMSATEADQMFASGKAAMYYEGAWKPLNFENAGGSDFIAKVGRLDFPAMTDCPEGENDVRVGGCFIGLMVRTGLPEEKEKACIQLAKDLASPEFYVPIMEKGSSLYAGTAQYDKTKVSEVQNENIRCYETTEKFIPSMDCIAPSSVDNAIKKTAIPGLITGEFTVEQAVAEVQKAASDYASTLEK